MNRELDVWIAKNIFNAFAISEYCDHILWGPSADWRKIPDYTSDMNEAVKILKKVRGSLLMDGLPGVLVHIPLPPDLWHGNETDFKYRAQTENPAMAICMAVYCYTIELEKNPDFGNVEIF